MNLNNLALFQQQAFIAGQWRHAISGESFAVFNPATSEKLGSVPTMGSQETREAIEKAAAALPAWRAKTAEQRSQVLMRWYQLIIDNQDDLARIMTLEQGKPLAEARGEIIYGASFIQWFAEEAKRVYGDIIPSPKTNAKLMVLKQPVGVCAAITPWNFPSAMITRKAAAALAAGCTMVIKPAEETPFSALALMVLAQQAGVPDGVLSLITGDAETIGAELTANPLVRKLSFTGSTEVGRLLYKQCAPSIKKLSLELGGNAPFIVFDDADIAAAVEGAIAAKFRNAGQTCVCTNRFYIHQAVYQEFLQQFVSAVSQLKLGNGLEADVDIGPLINQQAVDKVFHHINDALNKGAKLELGGNKPSDLLMQPTVLSQVSQHALLAKEETFGPLAALIPFDDEQEVIRMANDTDYGLAAYFYSRDIGRIMRVAEQLEYGIVGVNSGLVSTAVAPFGGMKASGLGREGSKYGIEEYLETQYLHLAF